MKCPKCYSDNQETATFCADCDTNLTLSKDIKVTETLETPKDGGKSKGQKTIFLAGPVFG